MSIILKHLHRRGVHINPWKKSTTHQSMEDFNVTRVRLWLTVIHTKILIQKQGVCPVTYHARWDDNMKPIMFLTPGMSHTPIKISHTINYCLIKGSTVCYQCRSQEALRASPKTWVVRMWVWAYCILVSVWADECGSVCYSHAILPSKLESAMAKACTAHIG